MRPGSPGPSPARRGRLRVVVVVKEQEGPDIAAITERPVPRGRRSARPIGSDSRSRVVTSEPGGEWGARRARLVVESCPPGEAAQGPARSVGRGRCCPSGVDDFVAPRAWAAERGAQRGWEELLAAHGQHGLMTGHQVFGYEMRGPGALISNRHDGLRRPEIGRVRQYTGRSRLRYGRTLPPPAATQGFQGQLRHGELRVSDVMRCRVRSLGDPDFAHQ